MRVLVFGSRNWSAWRAVWNRLSRLFEVDGRLVVVHGACPTGADRHARGWVTFTRLARALAKVRRMYPRPLAHDGDTSLPLLLHLLLGGQPCDESHPADWATHGRKAGPIRQQEMVDRGANMGLGFRSPGYSPGTDGTAMRCRRAGIPVELVHS